MLKSTYYIILLTLSTLLFTGCMAQPSAPSHVLQDLQKFEVNDNQGLLYIKREKTMIMGAAATVGVYIDDKFIGKIGNQDGYYAVALDPGIYALKITNETVSFSQQGVVRIKGGEKLIVKGDLMDLMKVTPHPFYEHDIRNSSLLGFNYMGETSNSSSKIKYASSQHVDSKIKNNDLAQNALMSMFGTIKTANNNNSTVNNARTGVSGKTNGVSNNQSVTGLDSEIKNQNVKIDNKKWALVIGIDKYEEQANVNYAANSARTFALSAHHSLGVPKENIISLIDSKATSGRIKSQISLIKELVENGDTIYFYFAGHGVPGRDGKTYILPSDMSADTIHMEPNLELDTIYKTLHSSQANRIYAFIDSCFSGKDDSGKLVYRGVAPVFKKKKDQFSSNKLTVITAGGSNEFANQYEKEEQRLFGYYLIKGLSQNYTDIDKLYEYVRRNVKRASLKIGLGYKQVPKIYKSK